MRRTGWIVLALTAALAAAGCEDELVASPEGSPSGEAGVAGQGQADGADPANEKLEPTVPIDEIQPSPGAGGPPPPGDRSTSGVPPEFMRAVIADAADRAGVPADRVEVLRAQPAQWRDGSLGCPAPGEMAIQMIVDGYWVELQASGRDFDYRLDGSGWFRLCQQPDRSPPYETDR
jgi:hypothetical protein